MCNQRILKIASAPERRVDLMLIRLRVFVQTGMGNANHVLDKIEFTHKDVYFKYSDALTNLCRVDSSTITL